ncbi:MAG TPA: universal stress protein [Dissulfurispiraceae bacterium]
MKVLVAYDGTLQSKEALKYGLDKVKENGGELVALHVFKSNMFVDYDSIPGAEDIARGEAARFVAEAEQLIRKEGRGVRAKVLAEDGNPAEEIINYAMAKNIDVLLCPPRYRSIIDRIKRTLKEEGRDINESRILDDRSKVKMSVVSVPAK